MRNRSKKTSLVPPYPVELWIPNEVSRKGNSIRWTAKGEWQLVRATGVLDRLLNATTRLKAARFIKMYGPLQLDQGDRERSIRYDEWEQLRRRVESGLRTASALGQLDVEGGLPSEFKLTIDGSSRRFVLRTSGLGLVFFQIAAAEFSAHPRAVCAGCTKLYPPSRRPRADRANYCPACRLTVAAKLRQQDYRSRRRAT